MDDLEKESLTGVTGVTGPRVSNVNEDTTRTKLTCRRKTTKFTFKGNGIIMRKSRRQGLD